MIARWLIIALLAPAAAPDDLETRAQTLRAELAAPEGSAPDSRTSIERQLLTSLERRRDLERARRDAMALLQKKPAEPVPPPKTLLELDDLRRELQGVDVTLAAGERRAEVLHADRDAAAAWLAENAASLRQARDAGAPAEKIDAAKLWVEYAESATAELDAMLGVVELQQKAANAERHALGRRLAAASKIVKPSEADIAEIERRLAARSEETKRRLAEAVDARENAHRDLEALGANASPHRAETLKETLATRDIGIEVAREALSNFTLEEAAWRLAIRYWRDNDPAAIVEVRARGPETRARVQRRLDFIDASTEQVMTRLGGLTAETASAADANGTAERQALRATLEERLRILQSAHLDQRRMLALIDRLRGDFDERVGVLTFKDRVTLALASLRDAADRAWNLELFTVNQTIDVDGRQTSVPRSVTVAKIVKAPLLLLVGLFLAFHSTKWLERYARRRGADEAGARLARRWTFGLLACACALTSLALAGIPFAAFAFVGGAVAIGVGFGMQTLFKNLISGMLVLIERPFRLGDEIQIGDLCGRVVDIDLRSSVVREGDGSETLVPNSVLLEQNVKAIAPRSNATRQSVAVTVDNGSDPRNVIEAMRSAAERHGQLLHSREPAVLLDEFASDGLRFSMQYWIDGESSSERRRIASDLRMMILGAFQDAGIRLAQTQLDVRLRKADEIDGPMAT